MTAYDAATTYKLTVGGLELVSEAGDSDATTTAGNIATAWNALSHIYATGVTADNNSSDTITFTANTAGPPFTIAPSVSDGTGTLGAFTTTTAATGPNHWDDGDNWWDDDNQVFGNTPGASDDVELRDSDVNICWGIDQNSIALTSLTIHRSFTGRLGLDLRAFATSSDGETVTNAVREYRQRYLKIKSTSIDIGVHNGIGSPTGSPRIMIDAHDAQSTITIFKSGSQSAETELPSVRLLANHSSTVVNVREAETGVGIAVDEEGETATIATLIHQPVTGASYVRTGDGLTLTTVKHNGGDAVIRAAATITTVTVTAGTLTTEGTAGITTFNSTGFTGGTAYLNATGTIATLNADNGSVDFTKSGEARTVTNANVNDKGSMKYDPNVVTMTNPPAGNGIVEVKSAA